MENLREVELPRPEKRRRTEEQNQLQHLQNLILGALKDAPKPPAKIGTGQPLSPETLTALTQWASRYGYVLHYKEKRKHFDDIPGDIRHEGREAQVYTIELYWVIPE